ncbi:MAG: LytR C-terminal domain-containing protein [Clostridia bacterium]|nr:LytR C-terminal domain-containing protein [Clostridia bacterium]
MDRKLYFNLVFLITGSFLVITMGIIVTMNFFKDSRVFQKDVPVAVQETASKPSAEKPQVSEKDKETEDYETLKYKRSPGVLTENTAKGKNVPDPMKDEGPPVNHQDDARLKEKISVEVINYSGIKNLAEEIKSTLEASGYEVSAGNGKSSQPVKTIIIERNDKKAGAEIQKILKAGTVTKWPVANSRFDVTVKIGDDYKP